MNELFSKLLISSPNDGGLFLVHAGKAYKLDNLNTTGMYYASGVLSRGLQPDSFWAAGAGAAEISPAIAVRDVHDVLMHGDRHYLVGTTGNEIIELDRNGAELRRWALPGEPDSHHVNCLGVWDGRIVFSAFGDFTETRGYKEKSAGAGYVQNLLTGERLISGLSQPHSLVAEGQNLLVANSEEMELREYSPAGALLRCKKLNGYTRGICVDGDFIYVGLSRSRNLEELSIESAQLVALNRKNWEELGSLSLPVNEIYSIVSLGDAPDLLATIATLADNASRASKTFEQLSAERFAQTAKQIDELHQNLTILEHTVHKKDNENFHLNQIITQRDIQLSARDAQLVSRDGQIQAMQDEMVHEGEVRTSLEIALSEMRSSTSWRITAPLRGLSRLAKALKGPYPLGGDIFNNMRATFRLLPLPSALKNRLRFFILMRSGLFTSQHTTLWQETDVVEAGAEAADAQYVAFKQRLHQLAVSEQMIWSPRAETLLSLSGKDLARVASALTFPAVSTPKVSIIVPVYGNAALTLECLSSIRGATEGIDYEIIVADDASPDQTFELLGRISGTKVQRNPNNLGFLRNCNAALPLATGEYVVYLNNDVQVKPGWLDGLLAVFAEHTDAGAAGPKIVYPSGHLQEAGVALKSDASADMVGLNDNPAAARYEYVRAVDYCSGACLMVRRDLLVQLGGFSDELAPAYCEDADLCLRIIEQGYKIYYTPRSTIVHHLSKTTAADGESKKLQQVFTNLVKLHARWAPVLDKLSSVKVIAFYLPQFHPIPENDLWWGKNFTEWVNVRKAKPNFNGHNQPRIPADLGYYDLRDDQVMLAQAELARKYGVDGFCFYYYWFGGKRLLEMPIERMLETGSPNFPYCLCWANENWSRRWDGRDQEILIGQQHSPADDRAVILDLIRHFRSPNYIRIDGRPHLIIYRVDLFPDFLATSRLWRDICREQGIGEIYLSMIESHDLVHKGIHPSTYGCDAAIEFPPLNMGVQTHPSGEIVNPNFQGSIGDYRETALNYCARPLPGYTRFRGAMPGWDNTARRQNNGFCFEHSNPGVFQAWLEHILRQTRQQHHGDEKMVFINAWNEWAEGAYLEPDTLYGHAFLEAVKNAKDAERLLVDRRGNH